MASFAEAVATLAPPQPVCAPADEARGEEKLTIAVGLAMLPLRLKPARRLTGVDLGRFCGGANSQLRIEMEPDGELRIMSPTHSETGRKNNALSAQLYIWAEQTESGEAFDSSTGFTLPDGSMRSPDASWVSRARWNALSPEERENFAPICPEFVVELVSASDPLSEVRQKMAMWIANGASLAWLIDPGQRTVEIYRPGQAEAEVHNDPVTLTADGPIAGFTLRFMKLWR